MTGELDNYLKTMVSMCIVNSLPHKQTIDLSKLKAVVENKQNVSKLTLFHIKR